LHPQFDVKGTWVKRRVKPFCCVSNRPIITQSFHRFYKVEPDVKTSLNAIDNRVWKRTTVTPKAMLGTHIIDSTWVRIHGGESEI